MKNKNVKWVNVRVEEEVSAGLGPPSPKNPPGGAVIWVKESPQMSGETQTDAFLNTYQQWWSRLVQPSTSKRLQFNTDTHSVFYELLRRKNKVHIWIRAHLEQVSRRL